MGDESKAQGAASADSPAATATGKDVGLLGDAFIRFQRQGRPSIINALMTLERSPKRGAIEAVLTKLGTEYPVFRSYPRKPCSGGMKWVTVDMADFRVEDHLVRHEIALGGPTPEGQAGTMDAAVSQYVSTRLTDPVPMQEGGMWEVHMVTFTGAGATERCDVVWRISHSCGDGMMLSTVLVGLCEAIDPAKPKKPRTKRPTQKVNCCSMLCTAISAWNKVRVCVVVVVCGGGGGVHVCVRGAVQGPRNPSSAGTQYRPPALHPARLLFPYEMRLKPYMLLTSIVFLRTSVSPYTVRTSSQPSPTHPLKTIRCPASSAPKRTRPRP